MMNEFNNKDWLYAISVDDFDRVKLMVQSIDPVEITCFCSPSHVQSVLQDMQTVIIALTLKLGAK